MSDLSEARRQIKQLMIVVEGQQKAIEALGAEVEACRADLDAEIEAGRADLERTAEQLYIELHEHELATGATMPQERPRNKWFRRRRRGAPGDALEDGGW